MKKILGILLSTLGCVYAESNNSYPNLPKTPQERQIYNEFLAKTFHIGPSKITYIHKIPFVINGSGYRQFTSTSKAIDDAKPSEKTYDVFILQIIISAFQLLKKHYIVGG